MTNLRFIARCKGGTERNSSQVVASRLHRVWMPLQLHSQSSGRGKTRSREVQIKPLMPYLFCEDTGDHMRHFLDHRDIFLTVWFIPPRRSGSDGKLKPDPIEAYRASVEARFANAMQQVAEDVSAFHCTYTAGQSVLVQMGRDILPAVFKSMNDDGTDAVDVHGLSFASRITAHPGSVRAG